MRHRLMTAERSVNLLNAIAEISVVKHIDIELRATLLYTDNNLTVTRTHLCHLVRIDLSGLRMDIGEIPVFVRAVSSPGILELMI